MKSSIINKLDHLISNFCAFSRKTCDKLNLKSRIVFVNYFGFFLSIHIKYYISKSIHKSRYMVFLSLIKNFQISTKATIFFGSSLAKCSCVVYRTFGTIFSCSNIATIIKVSLIRQYQFNSELNKIFDEILVL
jgi:hypothetical protein